LIRFYDSDKSDKKKLQYLKKKEIYYLNYKKSKKIIIKIEMVKKKYIINKK